MTTITMNTAVQLRKSDSDSRWRSRRQENEDETRRRGSNVEELPEILQDVEQKVGDRLQILKREEEILISQHEEEKRQEEKRRDERRSRERNEQDRRMRRRNRESEEKAAEMQEHNLKERQANEETDKAFKDFQSDHTNTAPVLHRCNSIRDRLKRFERKKEEEEKAARENGISEEETSTADIIDLHTTLEEIASGRQGYDPDKEREQHDKADEVFKSYQKQQKRAGSLKIRRKSSVKATKLVRSLTFEEEYAQAKQRVVIRRTGSERRVSEGAIQLGRQDIGSVEHHGMEGQAEDKDEVVEIDEGHVQRRMALFRQTAESQQETPQRMRSESRQASRLRSRDRSHETVEESQGAKGTDDLTADEKEALELFQNEERKASRCKKQISSLRLSNKTEEALEKEEEYHTAALAISRCKRRLLRLGITVNVTSHLGMDTIKLTRDNKLIAEVTMTPRETCAEKNEDSEEIPEGTVGGKLKNFQA